MARHTRHLLAATLPPIPPERALWADVLYRAHLDLLRIFPDGEEADLARADVVEWLGTEDFSCVCDLAGVPEELALSALLAEATTRG